MFFFSYQRDNYNQIFLNYYPFSFLSEKERDKDRKLKLFLLIQANESLTRDFYVYYKSFINVHNLKNHHISERNISKREYFMIILS